MVVEEEPRPELEREASLAITRACRTANAKHLMALAMMKASITRKEIIKATGISNSTYARLYQDFLDKNYASLTKEVIESWEDLLRAKMLSVSERALDKTMIYLETDDPKGAKLVAETFAIIFDKFRLSTGQSTENISTRTLIDKVFEGRRKLQSPNQSQMEITNDTTV